MRRDFRFALRAVAAHPWFSLAIAAALALGIGLNTMVFTLVYAVIYKPVPLPGGARLVIVTERDARAQQTPVSYPDFLDFQSQSAEFERLEAGRQMSGVISESGIPPQNYTLEQVSSGLFSMLQTRPVLGRGPLPSDTQAGAAPVVWLSYDLWRQRYGGANDAVGRTVRVNASAATVAGVMPRGFSFPDGVALWMPLVGGADMQKRSDRSVTLYGLLKPGTTIAPANAELGGIARRLAATYPQADKGIGAEARTFNAFYNGPQVRTMFLAMLVAVGMVLLIVCANVANMMLSRVLARQHELSIRVALGASRWRLMRQLLIESLVLSAAGGALGLGLAAYGVHWFDLATQNVGKPTWIVFKIDYTVFGYFALLCILAGVIAGLAPALRAARADVGAILKQGERGVTRRGGLLSGAFVALQLALTLVLLTGAGLFVRALLTAQDINRFVPSQQIVTGRISLPDARYPDAASRVRFFDQLLAGLSAIPGVSQAAITNSPPGLGIGRNHIEIAGHPVAQPLDGPSAALLAVSPGYFQTVNLGLLRGRVFTPTDGAPGQEVAIITRGFGAHFWPGRDALGQRFRVYDNGKYSPWLTIVGVSADLTQSVGGGTPHPLFFVPYRQQGWGGMAVLLRTASGNTSGLVLAARKAVQKLDQDLPLTDADTLAGAIHHDQWYLRVFGGLFALFAGTGLFIAAIGLYAVMAQATTLRTREIGVRMALGASPGRIARLVLGRGSRQLLAGFAIGLAAAYPAARVMAALPLGVSASDPLMFVTVSALLIGVGLLACYLPARRASALDPARAIREA